MHTNFKEVSELYHHGVKGMKWGVINEKDDQETRLASEKNRLEYEQKIAQTKAKNETELELARLDSKTAVRLGKQELEKSFSQDAALRQKSADERKAKERKYKMIGTSIIAALLIGAYISKKAMSSKRYATKQQAATERLAIKSTVMGKAIDNGFGGSIGKMGLSLRRKV